MKRCPGAKAQQSDKGDTLILAVLPRDADAAVVLERELTPERVAAHFAPLVRGEVRRVVQPHLPGLVFTLPGVLGGGVTGSPVLDGHGKALSYHLLSLEV
ncbi:AtuA-related protein [Modestobacter lacusdianchii]